MTIEGVKYNLDNNINPEVQDFLADGILQTKEFKALTEIFKQNKAEEIVVSEGNLHELKKIISGNSEFIKEIAVLEFIDKIKANVNNILEDNNLYTQLNDIDFRPLKRKYPREASIKNNNPAGLTWSKGFAKILEKHGIQFFRGTERPRREKNYYFGFPNMKEGMRAFDLLWSIKLRKMGNRKFSSLAKNWAKNWKPYRRKFGKIWNKKLSSLSKQEILLIKQKQMSIESPGMYKELKNLNIFT